MNFKDSKPIVVTKDGTVVKGLRIRNPHGFSIIIKANNVTVQECDLEGSINIYGAVKNTVIQNNYIHDITPRGTSNFNKQFAGVTTTEGDNFGNPLVQPLGAENVTVRGNYFANNPSGIYLVGCKGNIYVDGNYSFNHRGPFPRGQLVQLLFCYTTPTTEIIIENNFAYIDPILPEQYAAQTNGHQGSEDNINCNNSRGCPESPIIIRNNYIHGCSASRSNSGIMAGDGGGEYYHILNNKIYYTENCGIGICGGTGNIIRGNTIYQDKDHAWPERWSGRGIQIECYGTKFYGNPAVLVEDNKVCFYTVKRSSLFCSTDLAEFHNNTICEPDEFGPLDEFPAHEPPSAVPGLARPWEHREEDEFEIL